MKRHHKNLKKMSQVLKNKSLLSIMNLRRTMAYKHKQAFRLRNLSSGLTSKILRLLKMLAQLVRLICERWSKFLRAS